MAEVTKINDADASASFNALWRDRDINPNTLDQDLRDHYADEWQQVLARYHANPRDFHAAWWYLHNHPIAHDGVSASFFGQHLDVYVAKVDPNTLTIEDATARNTCTQVWLEFGPMYFKEDMSEEEWAANHYNMWGGHPVPSHDVELDCGADSYEDAIIKLADLVAERYGDDRNKVYD